MRLGGGMRREKVHGPEGAQGHAGQGQAVGAASGVRRKGRERTGGTKVGGAEIRRWILFFPVLNRRDMWNRRKATIPKHILVHHDTRTVIKGSVIFVFHRIQSLV